MASGPDLGDLSRFAKLGMAIGEILAQACRDVLEMEVPPERLFTLVNESRSRQSTGHHMLRPYMKQISNAGNNGYKDFDISLSYLLMRNICEQICPTEGWSYKPSVEKITVGDDIERIRHIRNTHNAHNTSASTPKKEFDETWSVISDVCQRLQTHTKKDYMSGLRRIQRYALKEERVEPAEEKHEGLHSDIPGNVKRSIPPQYIEKLEKSLKKNCITVQHSRGILVGCAEAGKTTLLNRLMGETQEVVEDIESSRGLEVHHHVFNIRNGCLEGKHVEMGFRLCPTHNCTCRQRLCIGLYNFRCRDVSLFGARI